MSATLFAASALLLMCGAMAIDVPALVAEVCGDREVVDMTMMGVTVFNAASFTPQDSMGGLCILGTSENDVITGTGFDDVILGFKGK